MASIIESLTSGLDFLKYLNPFDENFILKTLLDYINPFSENFILKDVLDFLGNILSYINPFDENFFGYKLIEMFGDLLRNLFVPKQESFEKIHNTFNSRLGFVDVIKSGINELQQRLEYMENGERSAYPSLSVDINSAWYTGEAVIFDCYWFAPYREHIHLFVSAFCYLFFMFRVYKHMPSIISGFSTFGGED